MQWKTWFVLVGVRLKTTFVHFLFWIQDCVRFYPKLSFAKLDLYLHFRSLYPTPFQRSARYIKEKGWNEEFTYGETPLSTLEKMARETSLSASDHVLDLGCGRGRTLFFLHYFYGCKVTGVECIPPLLELAQGVQEKFAVANVQCIKGDFFSLNLGDYNFIYLYGSMLTVDSVARLSKILAEVKPGTKLVTVSYPLEGDAFEVMKIFQGNFDWGTADIFYQIKK